VFLLKLTTFPPPRVFIDDGHVDQEMADRIRYVTKYLED
jgi:hypothetical protein